MSKTLVYLTIAVFLGLFLVLIPLATFTEADTGAYRSLAPEFVSGEAFKVEPIEALGNTTTKYLADDFTVLLTSLAIAFFVYILFKHKMFAS